LFWAGAISGSGAVLLAIAVAVVWFFATFDITFQPAGHEPGGARTC
jgi:Cft2 family RNA processing exonuclease